MSGANHILMHTVPITKMFVRCFQGSERSARGRRVSPQTCSPTLSMVSWHSRKVSISSLTSVRSWLVCPVTTLRSSAVPASRSYAGQCRRKCGERDLESGSVVKNF